MFIVSVEILFLISGGEGVGCAWSGVIPHIQEQGGLRIVGLAGDAEDRFGDAHAAKVERLFGEVDEEDGRGIEVLSVRGLNVLVIGIGDGGIGLVWGGG